MSGAFLIGRSPDGTDRPAEIDANGALKVNVGGATLNIEGDVTVSNEVEVKKYSGDPVPVVSGLEIPEHDFISLSYSGNNLTGVVYKVNGANGSVVASLALDYDQNNQLISIAKN